MNINFLSLLVERQKIDIHSLWDFGLKFRKFNANARVCSNVQLPIFPDLEWTEHTQMFDHCGQTSDIVMRLVMCPKFDIQSFETLARKFVNCMGILGLLPKSPKFDSYSFCILDPNFENWTGMQWVLQMPICLIFRI